MQTNNKKFKIIVIIGGILIIGLIILLSVLLSGGKEEENFTPPTYSSIEDPSGEKIDIQEGADEYFPEVPMLVGFNYLIKRGISAVQYKKITDTISERFSGENYESRISFVKDSFSYGSEPGVYLFEIITADSSTHYEITINNHQTITEADLTFRVLD